MHLLHRQEKDEKPMKDLVMGVPSKAKKKHQHKQILWWPYLTVVMCEQYKSISRSKFAKWLKIVFLKHWTWRSTPMIDGLFRMENLATIMVSIPSRSPDSNCIEKFFSPGRKCTCWGYQKQKHHKKDILRKSNKSLKYHC